jgi:hypothetical protein
VQALRWSAANATVLLGVLSGPGHKSGNVS